MKSLKFVPHLVPKIISGEKTSTWRLFDDKDLKAGDELTFINKETGETFGTAAITSLYVKTLGTLTDNDLEGHERFVSDDEMYATYRKYYGDAVNQDTEVKILSFIFHSSDLMAYLRNANSSLFRFEALQSYDVPQEIEMIGKYEKEGIIDVSHMKDWWNFVERKTRVGVQIQRVRLVSLPLSDYVKMELKLHKESALRGDDIRVLVANEELLQKMRFPPQDFWLIDDFVVLLMNYDQVGKYCGFTETDNVESYLSLKNKLLQNTIPIAKFKPENI